MYQDKGRLGASRKFTERHLVNLFAPPSGNIVFPHFESEEGFVRASERQQSLFPNDRDKTSEPKTKSRSGTFLDNMKRPIHRWFRYSAGFSAQWVEDEISRLASERGEIRLLDPFAGSGTSLLAADALGQASHGLESHPFIYRVARAKTKWDIDLDEFERRSTEVAEKAARIAKDSIRDDIPLLGKCFDPVTLGRLDALREVYLSDLADLSQESELIWLAITAIVRSCSSAGTAQWQYVLPNKKKARVADPFDAYRIKISQLREDISFAREAGWKSSAEIHLADARDPGLQDKFDLVITSPPYPNNYDYADATRLEMTFWGEITGWGELHEAVRQFLVRSCSQHSAKDKLELDELLADRVIVPIYDDLAKACRELAEIRLTKGGKKTYHTMAAAYFADLGNVFVALRRLCRDGARVCFVVGDSAPYGVYLAVDRWLGELAVAAGFKSYKFEKLRDRNIKWKNRKHRVPLHEGRLWIEG